MENCCEKCKSQRLVPPGNAFGSGQMVDICLKNYFNCECHVGKSGKLGEIAEDDYVRIFESEKLAKKLKK